MTMSRKVAEWIAARPGQCATLAELREHFRDQRLDGAISSGSRNGWIQHVAGVWRHTGVEMLRQGSHKGLDSRYDEQYELRVADEAFARLIGDRRYEDVPRISPHGPWRALPPAPDNVFGCSAALLVGERLR